MRRLLGSCMNCRIRESLEVIHSFKAKSILFLLERPEHEIFSEKTTARTKNSARTSPRSPYDHERRVNSPPNSARGKLLSYQGPNLENNNYIEHQRSLRAIPAEMHHGLSCRMLIYWKLSSKQYRCPYMIRKG